MIFLSKHLLVVRVTCSGSAYAQDTSPMSQEGIFIMNVYSVLFFPLIYWFVIINFSYRSVGKVFCTMDGRGSMVHIHPSSAVNMFLEYLFLLGKIFFNSNTVFISLIYGCYYPRLVSVSCFFRNSLWRDSKASLRKTSSCTQRS